jgi:hypothetical protein
MEGGKLAPGKFGNCPSVSPTVSLDIDTDMVVSYAGWKGAISYYCTRKADGIPAGLWGPTIPPEVILTTLAGKNWTWEFWLKPSFVPKYEVTIIDLGYAYEPGVSFKLAAKAGSFDIQNAYAGFRATCPTNVEQLGDRRWHHVAFTRSAATGQVRHFLDGTEQPFVVVEPLDKQPLPPIDVPEDRDSDQEWCRQNRFNFSLGHNRYGLEFFSGMFDELRLSDVIRYSGNFSVPGSFSRNYGTSPHPPAVPDGLGLLFSPDAPPDPVLRLGSRKHVFIDDALVETMNDVKLTMNRPIRDDTDVVVGHPRWRPGVFDKDGAVHMVIPDSYESEKGSVLLLTSDDGVHFVYHSQSPIIKGTPCYGNAWRDLNPAAPAEERFKFTAWVGNRGIYLYVSPDGIHWRRNETIMLPLVRGGEAESYWDDQRGCYISFLKHDASFKSITCPGGGRRGILFETVEITQTWPFNVLAEPYFEKWPFPAVTCEGPVVFDQTSYGQVYRTRAIRYPWAPDAYLAFIWRYVDNACRSTELAVSRNGINWRLFADQGWYYEEGQDEEVVSVYGLIRRGDEIWQYADFGGCHATAPRTWARMTQRLDGFVSLDAEDEAGTIVTRLLIFKGSKLALNAAATGVVRVGLLNEAGESLSGFDVSSCDPIRSDSVGHVVTWNGNSNVDALAGRIVRVKFEMQNSKLYAFQFVGDTLKSNR